MKYKIFITFLFIHFTSQADIVEEAINDMRRISQEEESLEKENYYDNIFEEIKKPKVEKKEPVVEKKEAPKVQKPKVITKKELELLNNSNNKKKKQKKIAKANKKKEKKNPIYVPAPTIAREERTKGNWLLERDSSKIITKVMNTKDALTVKMCAAAGINISYHNEVEGEFQTIILDDNFYFSAVEMQNKRGVYVKLLNPVPEGKYWESALRLITKEKDETFLINLIGVPCPKGVTPFPKVIYIKPDNFSLAANSRVLTPEDTIIEASKGMPRIQKNRIRLYDMVTSSNSDWVVFGMEVQYLNNLSGKTSPKVVILDNLQISRIKSKLQYLPLQSKKSTELSKISSVRFRLAVNINKNYILNDRYLYIVFLDEEVGHYQYLRVDVLPYFLSLKNRGFNL